MKALSITLPDVLVIEPKETLKYSSPRRKPGSSSLNFLDSGVRRNDESAIDQRLPKVFDYDRGFFCKSCNLSQFIENIRVDVDFVQDIHIRSTTNGPRGLRYQSQQVQGKLARSTKR